MAFEGFVDTEPTDRLFFAFMPDELTAQRIARQSEAIRRRNDLRGSSLRTERFHITLIHVGDYVELPKGVVDDCTRVGAATTSGPLPVSFDRVQSFAGSKTNRPVVMVGGDDLQSLKAFRSELFERLRWVGVRPKSGVDFNPHVTLLYDARVIDGEGIEPISWRADELLLIHSELRRTKYNILGRWPLAA
jgi:RNA 2',3'-cyclic 3'-phosphodiesterase